MIALQQQADMAGDFGRYPSSYIAQPKSANSCRDSVISVSTTGSTRSVRSKASYGSLSSRTSYATIASEHEPAKKYRFDTAPKLVKTPWEADRSKRAFARQWQESGAVPRPSTGKSSNGLPQLPARIFKRLPIEVYQCIITQLAEMYMRSDGGACLTCYLADLNSLSLTSKSWRVVAQRALYQKLWIPVDDPVHQQNKSPIFLRMKQLRRSLRNKPDLAKLVREIHTPGLQSINLFLDAADRSTTVATLASLVMCCPNLEEFAGLYLSFDHEYDRLTHALSTRVYLKTHTWIMKGIEESYDASGELVTNARPVEYDGSIDNGDVFLNTHLRWQYLETLLLFGQDTGNLDYRAFVGTFRMLTSLKHLLVSGFDKKQFNDRTLAALPWNLQSLRLQDVSGVTERGLSRLASSRSLESMRNLSLINIEITSAKLIANILSVACRLQRFTLVQSVAPTLPGTTVDAPIYSSKSLAFLHWDISPFSQPSLAHLAHSIRERAFPSLRAICAPCDDGTLQILCRPRSSIARPSDSEAASALSLRSSLAGARLAAQERLEAARLMPLMRVIVTDERGVIQHKYTIKNFVGRVTSSIEYVLDGQLAQGPDDAGVLEVEALVGRAETSGGSGRDGGKAVIGRLGSCSGPPQGTATPIPGYLENTRNSLKSGKTHRAREKIADLGWKAFF
ncbi:hypothetical protein BT63DRAFT_428626 [Microthyrium microscopicum]|uniref:F-box domain-containing protein n=1 Tax=Microthyrium microscopicum TaxID=703497 RepID=A0A6A6U3H2_9PEZI|nr:hypothetical protein BT63DRAFT_428626 [Microthyrium microscopicum]